jgi:hypothetical protein
MTVGLQIQQGWQIVTRRFQQTCIIKNIITSRPKYRGDQRFRGYTAPVYTDEVLLQELIVSCVVCVCVCDDDDDDDDDDDVIVVFLSL